MAVSRPGSVWFGLVGASPSLQPNFHATGLQFPARELTSRCTSHASRKSVYDLRSLRTDWTLQQTRCYRQIPARDGTLLAHTLVTAQHARDWLFNRFLPLVGGLLFCDAHRRLGGDSHVQTD